MTNDPRAYLQRSGLVKNVTKSMEAGHAVPERGSPPMSKPEMKTKLGVSEAKIRVQKPAEFKQPDPAKTATRVNAMGAYRNMDKAHSGKYEKLEHKVIKQAGLKGSVEKVLSQGHNSKGAVSKKISHMVHEGMPQKQAVATALSMKRAGRLTKEGGYMRAKKKGKK